ncbi:MAG TPA: C39 family peptidase [Ktedonobacterales bacterium]|nr:C39 family peptidase [Ktedonobacterales bacterium]
MAASLPNVQVISESLAPVNGAIAGCGQAAVLMMNHIVTGEPVDANELLNLIKFSVATGHSVSPSGATRPSDLQWLAEQQGVKTTLGSGASWRSTVDNAIPAGKSVVLGVSNARAFGGSDSNVAGHYVTIVGTTTDGRYIVADPNQQAAKAGGTVIYSASQIQAAKPFATLTPTSAVQAQTTSDASATSGDCLHRVSWQGGPGGVGAFNLCLDPLLDFSVRGSLVATGVLLIIVAILIFTRHTWAPVVGDTAKAGAIAAAA